MKRTQRTALKETQNKTRSPSEASCSGLLVRDVFPLLLHREKHWKYTQNVIRTVSYDMASTIYAALL